MPRPYYIVFAGVNGAGKSTLYRTGLWQNGSFPDGLSRVNPDEIIVEHGWDWRSKVQQIEAGKEAVRRIKGYLECGESFSQETTLSGRWAARNILRARQCGFHVVLFYIGLDDPAIANARIAHRGSIGGHLVDAATVERRFQSSLANVAGVLDACSEAYLYDNTTALQLIAGFASGELFYLDPLKVDSGWLPDVLAAIGYEEIGL